ncbi:hypothetical protein F5B22DRAFT_163311 [Xylaria bambusicola]|uniref:uncharacterized protein n=1 Tax=Xylaria bambusicola TaxID=326684 RepID=UPI002008E4F8|nr:uncharacterized protein F5B22DRAFT_163311 [Xylaria bambusicola]KAI0526519.1 hypothetical protein F5B22DRAFT_163311 [Xylaria bambusicola]
MRVPEVFVALVGGASAVLGSPVPQTTNTGNSTVYSFADSCNGYKVNQIGVDVWLSASCRNTTGDWPYSQINLDHCIANNKGTMEAREDGYFGRTCDRMVMHGIPPVLYAFCNNGHEAMETVLDIGGFVDNDNGHLHCFGYYGEAY